MTIDVQSAGSSSNILIIKGIHGNEIQEVDVVLKELTLKYGDCVSCIIGNPRAVHANTRFTERDLNRVVSPSRPNADAAYEVRRGYELFEEVKRYSHVIDIHTTVADCNGVFTLIPNPSSNNLLLASALAPNDVVIWAAESSRAAGPVTQFVESGVGLEFGPRSNPSLIMQEMRRCLVPIYRDGILPDDSALTEKHVLRVCGPLEHGKISSEQAASLHDFVPVHIEGKTYFPLLVGQYEDVVCFLMEEVLLTQDDLLQTDQQLWDRFAY